MSWAAVWTDPDCLTELCHETLAISVNASELTEGYEKAVTADGHVALNWPVLRPRGKTVLFKKPSTDAVCLSRQPRVGF